MKNIFTKVALVTALMSTAYAGAILDLEVGGGMWSTSAPTGMVKTGGQEVDLGSEAALTSTSDNMYAWAVVDHLVPIVPNLRIEQVTLKSSGTKNLSAGLPPLITFIGDVDTDLDMSNTDFIAYWGVPFATWLPFLDELDFGLGVKAFSGSLLMSENISGDDLVNTSFSGAAIPYGYAKLRVEPPLFMGIGLEGELKTISYDTSSFNEIILKADWGLTAPLPILDIEAGVEVGYRTMSLVIDSADLKTDIGFDGIFFGVYGKFAI